MMLKRLFITLIMTGVATAGCNGNKGDPAGGSSPTPAAAVKPAQAPFKMTVEGPDKAALTEGVAATVKVVPQGEYKINLEYPTKMTLKAAGPTSAESTLSAKEGKVDLGQILFKPSFKLEAAGNYTFEGKLRFSVCTKKQCEIKNEKVHWVTQVEAGK